MLYYRLAQTQRQSSITVIPANTYRDVGGRATQEAKAEAGIQSNNTR